MTLDASFFDLLLSDVDLHARWLNVMSLLEYVGFRKIVKSQDAGGITTSTLRHLNEESRHALLLKRLAVRTGGPRFERYDREALLCGAEATAYFQAVDARVADRLGKTDGVYMGVTWLIEVRALQVYRDYDLAARARGSASGVEGLILEETRHLEEAEAGIRAADGGRTGVPADLIDFERRAYHALGEAMTLEALRATSPLAGGRNGSVEL